MQTQQQVHSFLPEFNESRLLKEAAEWEASLHRNNRRKV
jgi:hypothetical protein